MKKNIIFSLIVIIMMTCCKNNNAKYYKSGNLREMHYFIKKKKDSIIYYFDNKKSSIKKIVKFRDSLKYIKEYDTTGKLISEGQKLRKENLKIGKWFFYMKDTTRINEYKNIRGLEYLNQSWLINSKNDTIGGNYYILHTKDTVDVNEIFSIKLALKGYLFSINSKLNFILPKNPNNNFDYNFSNEREITYDTIYNLKQIGGNEHLKNRLLNHMIMVNYQFSSSGKKVIRGIVKELYKPTYDSIELEERNIYFDKIIYVK